MTKQYTVDIFGESYALVSDEPREHVQRIARDVDALFHELSHATHAVSHKRLAVLAALRLAHTLHAYEKRVVHLCEACEQECRSSTYTNAARTQPE